MSNVMRWPPSNRHLSPASVEVIRAVETLSRDQHQHGRYTFYPYTLKYKFKYQFNIKKVFIIVRLLPKEYVILCPIEIQKMTNTRNVY